MTTFMLGYPLSGKRKFRISSNKEFIKIRQISFTGLSKMNCARMYGLNE